MSEAWTKPALQNDSEMNLRIRYDRAEIDRAREECIAEMLHSLGRHVAAWKKSRTLRRRDAAINRVRPPQARPSGEVLKSEGSAQSTPH